MKGYFKKCTPLYSTPALERSPSLGEASRNINILEMKRDDYNSYNFNVIIGITVMKHCLVIVSTRPFDKMLN